jgi:hypothetical protein
MQELINQLVEKAGITEQQAVKSIEAVKDFVKEKFPMMAGAVDNLLGTHDGKPNSDANDAGSY